MDLNPIRLLVKADDQTAQAFSSVQNRLGGLERASGSVERALKNMIGPLTIAGIVAIGKSSLNSADEIAVLSKQLGLSTEALSQYRYVAAQWNTDFRGMAKAVQMSQKAISESSRGIGEARPAFGLLHLDLAKLKAMKPEDAFEAIGDAISKIPDAADRSAIAMKVFGESGSAMIPIFAEGAAGVRKLREEASSLGLSLSHDAAFAAKAADDAMTKLTSSVKALGVELAVAAAPAVEKLSNSLSGFMQRTRLEIEAGKWLKTLPDDLHAYYRALGEKQGTAGMDIIIQDMLKARDVTDEFKTSWGQMIASLNGPAPLLPGLTDEGKAAAAANYHKESMQLAKSLKIVEVATDGLTAAERARFQQLERTVQLAQQAQAESDYGSWLADQLMPTDDQAAQAAIEAQNKAADAVSRTIAEQERLRRESTLTWQLMTTGVNNVANQLSNNLAAAIAGARVQLLDIASLAEQILSMAFRYAIQAGLNAVFPGAGSVAGAATGGIGPTPSGAPLPGKALATGAGSLKSGPTIIQNITVKGTVDANNPMSVRRLAAVLYEETLKIQRHHGPMGSTA